jgi:hypothetical protein
LRRATVATVIATLLSGCHARTRLNIPGESPAPIGVRMENVKTGDEVRIVLRDGTLVGVKVAEVRADEIVGLAAQRYQFADMVRLERQHVSVGRTAGLVVGLYAAIAALFTVVALLLGAEFSS